MPSPGRVDRPRTDLPTQFVPGSVEAQTYQRWIDQGVFTPPAEPSGPAYTIVIPPPNVTGALSIAHAFQHTLMDALVRRRRMQGYDALWLPGMDHAGIATQNVVERELARDGLSRHDVGRKAFVQRVWCWKAEYGGKILDQMRRLGDGVDWSRERFTMDDGLSRAVVTLFKRLYDDGLVYRAERIINWCPRCLTALSDIEVEHSEDEGELVSIRYGEGDRSIVVATTRVETMLGDTAVAVHPQDARYARLVGTEVELPLTGRRIPVVADAHVDPDFGTGAVKVTPAHDPNDFEIGQRHGLPSLTVMDERGVITAHGPFEGLDRFEARPAVLAALRAQGRVVAEKRPYLHNVGHCQRCDTVVEPRLSLQWFVKVAPLAQAAGEAVRDGRTTIHPPELAKRYFDWVDAMHDWCISRQLWWGHRIPVWYGPDGEVVVVGPDEEPPGEGWTQDPDVLDTWFSSGQWPYSTLGWPDDTADLRRFYPTDVLLTGYDILFFWVVRMMMFGLYVMDEVPFRTVALTGLVRDQFGQKMSKSKGNTVDPLLWIDAYGADATRFALARGANPGTDVPIGEDWVRGTRNFMNKVWNATRFALMNGADASGPLPPASELSVADRWVLSRLQTVAGAVDEGMDDFQFARTCDILYHFAWDEVFDWYVELVKAPIAAGGPAADAARSVLGHVIDVLLRLLHPLVPFITEELWRSVTGGDCLATATWPAPDPSRSDPAAEREVTRLQEAVTEVRRFRADQGLRPRQKVPGVLVDPDGTLAAHLTAIGLLADLAPVALADQPPAGWPAVSVGDARIAVDLSGTVDVAAERARLGKDRAAAEKELATVTAKLGNETFVARAPEPVVAKMRARLAAAEADLARIDDQLAALARR